MQNAKDTFYEVLRDRVAAANTERTAVVRGVTRAAVIVEENELASVPAPVDCFRLRWVGATVDGNGALPLVTLRCEVMYETAGSAELGGLDRGRALAAMDAELSAAVRLGPQRVVKKDFRAVAEGGAPVAMEAQVWWGDVSFGAAEVAGARLRRVATVEVMSFRERGEL